MSETLEKTTQLIELYDERSIHFEDDEISAIIDDCSIIPLEYFRACFLKSREIGVQKPIAHHLIKSWNYSIKPSLQATQQTHWKPSLDSDRPLSRDEARRVAKKAIVKLMLRGKAMQYTQANLDYFHISDDEAKEFVNELKLEKQNDI